MESFRLIITYAKDVEAEELEAGETFEIILDRENTERFSLLMNDKKFDDLKVFLSAVVDIEGNSHFVDFDKVYGISVVRK